MRNMARRNTAPRIQLQGITRSLNVPGVSTPNYNYMSGKAISKSADNWDSVMDIMKGIGQIKTAQRTAGALARGKGAEHGTLDAAGLKTILDAPPTNETIGMFPGDDVTHGDQDALNRWVAQTISERTRGMDADTLRGYVSTVAPVLTQLGGKYVGSRWQMQEDDRIRSGVFSMTSGKQGDDSLLQVLESLQGKYTDAQITEKIIIPSAELAISAGNNQRAMDILHSVVKPMGADGMAAMRSSYKALLPSLQKATYDLLNKANRTESDEFEFADLSKKFTKFTGEDASTYIAKGAKAWLNSQPVSNKSHATKQIDEMISRTTRGTQLWQDLTTEKQLWLDNLETKNRERIAAIKAKRTLDLQTAEERGANLIAKGVVTEAEEKSMFLEWEVKYPSLSGVMQSNYYSFKSKLQSAQKSETAPFFINLRDRLDNALTREDIRVVRSDISTQGNLGNLTADQFNTLVSLTNTNADIVEGKSDEVMLSVRSTLGSEWDSQLGVDTGPQGFRRISPEYRGSEITRNRLLNDFDREWRNWLKTKAVLTVLKSGDYTAWDKLRYEFLYTESTGLIDRYTEKLQTQLDTLLARNNTGQSSTELAEDLLNQ